MLHEAWPTSFIKPNSPVRLVSEARWSGQYGPFGFRSRSVWLLKPDQPGSWSQTVWTIWLHEARPTGLTELRPDRPAPKPVSEDDKVDKDDKVEKDNEVEKDDEVDKDEEVGKDDKLDKDDEDNKEEEEDMEEQEEEFFFCKNS